VYEQILNDLRSAGNAGEFYTPRAITEFMVKMVNPSLKKRETVLDPACGTGGFLTAAIAHLEGQISKKSGAEDRKAIAQCIRGIEKKQLPHLLCVTNMMLHGIDVPSMIEHRNTLATGWNDWKLTEREKAILTGGFGRPDAAPREELSRVLDFMTGKDSYEFHKWRIDHRNDPTFQQRLKARYDEQLHALGVRATERLTAQESQNLYENVVKNLKRLELLADWWNTGRVTSP
jgi:hypothetical protein